MSPKKPRLTQYGHGSQPMVPYFGWMNIHKSRLNFDVHIWVPWFWPVAISIPDFPLFKLWKNYSLNFFIRIHSLDPICQIPTPRPPRPASPLPWRLQWPPASPKSQRPPAPTCPAPRATLRRALPCWCVEWEEFGRNQTFWHIKKENFRII